MNIGETERICHAAIEEGILRFAWWNDGQQYVGTCGTTLAQALRDLDEEFNVPCPCFRFVRDESVAESKEYCSRCGVARDTHNAKWKANKP